MSEKKDKKKENPPDVYGLSESSTGSLKWQEDRSAASSVTNDIDELKARVDEMLSVVKKDNSKDEPYSFRPETNLVQLTDKKVMRSHIIFGSLYDRRYTPICFTPKHRPKRITKMLIPDGCACIVIENGKALGVFKPGRYFRSGFYQIAYCVNTQYIPYHFNISECPTRDNVRITIQIDFLLHVTNAVKFMYDIGPENLEELLRATQSEAVRSLARTTYVEKAYDLRGMDSQDMLDTLNDKLNPFGVNIDQVAIANVNLPSDVANCLQSSTSYISKTKEQIRMHEFKLLVQHDNQILRTIIQDRHNEIDMLVKNSRKERSQIKQDIRELIAKGDAEIIKAKAELENKIAEIQANSKLEIAKINAQRDAEVNAIITQANIEVQKINAQAEQYVSKVKSETELKISENRAQIIKYKGDAEKLGAQVLAAQRQYEIDMARVGIIEALSKNRTLISGDTENNIMTQLLVAQKTADQIGVKLKKQDK